jgi:1,4-alpha-glucan branching enzyme
MNLKRRAVPYLLALVTLAPGSLPFAQEATPPISSQSARTSPAWLTSGVIYQVFVRSFSPMGDLNGVTGRLDELHGLGVNILWLMPIHPDGQVKKKGSLGSP